MTKLRLRVQPPQGPAYDHECAGPTLVMGRSSKADLVLADRFVSRLHARLSRGDDGWYVEDLGSRNPTLLNDRPLTGLTRVSPGDRLRLSETLVVVEPQAQEPPGGGGPGPSSIFKSASTLMSVREADFQAGAAGEAALKRHSERLRLLNEVHRVLAGPISLEKLLELILDRAFDHLRPEEGAVFLKNPDGEFYRAASRRLPDETGEFLYSRSLVREVTEKGLAALVFDASADERFAAAESIVMSGVRSIVAAPLLDPEGCLGMIVLNSRAHVRRFAEEDMELLVSLASAAALRIRNIALAEEAAQRRLLEKELALAHDIQMAMLPKEFPERREFELAAALRPAKSVGGDLYDFLLDGDRLWFLVGDVSGKAMGAALFMAVTKTLFHAIVQTEPSLSMVLSRMNRELCRDNERSFFVTAFAGCLDLRTGDLVFGNAGHNPPYLLGCERSLEALTTGRGVALGVVGDFAYETGRLRLEPGDRLYLYTDGVVEALNGNGEQFSDERLRSFLRDAAGASAAEVVEGSLRAVQEFAGQAPQFDDITVMSLRYLSAA